MYITISRLELQQKDRKYKKELIRDEEFNSQNKKYTDGSNSRIDDAEKWMSDLEDRVMEITQMEQKNF